ncbi:dnaJ homolog subfamily C member 2-like [Babylonia areolata]|uniref:dnaJ homolog subfamily C member 2-like n=1 Tax=Babylonia areolata TaxID=304850 RepID=UPI003FD35A92
MIPYAEEDEVSEVFGALSAGKLITVEATGQWFGAYQQRVHGRQSVDSSSSSEEEEEIDEVEESEEDQTLLMGLNPKEWKKQDHYAVLGLSKLRYKATADQIKRVYRQKVLLHHPDKRRARGLHVENGDNDYFLCISRAYEILGDPAKRRSFDSVDPEFDESVPSVSQEARDSFFATFRPVFEHNARWSNKKRVPQLGDENTDFDHVNAFYNFWYAFDSWREFSYKDEEEKEKGENREERRWIEKQNKAARQKLKKEETARVRQLVDNAYACDPRIQKFKDEEKEKKLAAKRAKQEAARQRAEEEERARAAAEEEERKRKEKEEEEAKAQAAAAKKEKEALKKQMRKERKTLRQVAKDYEYFASSEEERIKMLEEVDKLSELLSLTSLQDLNSSLSCGDRDRAKEAFLAKVAELQDQLDRDKRQHLEAANKSSSGGGSGGGSGDRKAWSDDELQMLIKAVNLFPAGTKDRWEVIAAFIGQHVTGSNKNARDVLSKAKELQKNDLTLRQGASKQAFSNFEKDHKPSTSGSMEAPSKRLETAAEAQLRETGTNPAPWTADEQKLLEQAMKTYGPNTPERWDRIAETVPNRSKKDCMKRYKELCEIVRAKKAAQEAAKAKKS